MKFLRIFLIFLLPVIAFSKDLRILENDCGILEVNVETYKERVVIINQDGTEWMNFGFDYENLVKDRLNYSMSDIKKLYHWNNDFHPYFTDFDNAEIMFRCVGVKDGYFRVIVNDSTGLEKLIKKTPQWTLHDWPNHLTKSVCTIDFDKDSNPMRLLNGDNSAKIKINGELDPAIQIVKVDGDWIKIKCQVDDNTITGWIKWKENERVIIDLYYDM